MTGAIGSPFAFMMTTKTDSKLNVLHQLDPRVKLVLSVVTIASVFAATSWSRLTLLFISLFFLLKYLGALTALKQRFLWLRWFIVVVIAMHAFLSPGYTLLGVSWLSYDGFIHGLKVSAQIVIALAVSLFLTRSSTADQLASALGSMLTPFRLFGLNVENFSRQILLAINFVPILRQESAEAVAKTELENKDDSFSGMKGRTRKLTLIISPLIIGLLDKADVMAHQNTIHGELDTRASVLPPFFPVAHIDRIAIVIFTLFFVLCLVLP